MSDWIRAGIDTDEPIWGLRKGIQVAIWPGAIEGYGQGGPRGLLRIGYPILDGGRAEGLINFVAVEPVVAGHRGYSELEESALDGVRGKRMTDGAETAAGRPDPGTLEKVGRAERWRQTVTVERFQNGAHVKLDLEIRSDRPDELRLSTHSMPGSAGMERCVLTATMGNYARLRRLSLLNRVADPELLWPAFDGREFTDVVYFKADELPKDRSGEITVCATGNEADPGAVPPDPAGLGWHYRGSFPVTQYWKLPRSSWSKAARLRVNGRRLYWASHNPIPGGIAFENFELDLPFREGQTVVFGVTRRTPAEVLAEK